VVFAEQWIPSGLTALLLTTMPFFMVGLESLLPKGPKLNATILTGLVMGLFGVCLIFGEDIKYLAGTALPLSLFSLLRCGPAFHRALGEGSSPLEVP
jgi:drug/metabolite transporter (DMT)-like permease